MVIAVARFGIPFRTMGRSPLRSTQPLVSQMFFFGWKTNRENFNNKEIIATVIDSRKNFNVVDAKTGGIKRIIKGHVG